jgi:hypothetical protein
MRKFPHQIYAVRLSGFSPVKLDTPIPHNALMPSAPGGIVWLDRGLWCSLMRNISDGASAWHICTDTTFTYSARTYGLSRSAHEITRRQVAHETVGQLAAQFPPDLRHNVFVDLYKTHPDLQLGADGVPWEIHAIENRRAREAATRAFKEQL